MNLEVNASHVVQSALRSGNETVLVERSDRPQANSTRHLAGHVARHQTSVIGLSRKGSGARCYHFIDVSTSLTCSLSSSNRLMIPARLAMGPPLASPAFATWAATSSISSA